MKETNKWSVRDVITTVLLSAVLIVIQLVINMVCMANDFVSMVLSVGITMFLCAPVYMLMVSRIGKRFVTLIYMTILGVIFLLMGNWFLLPYYVLVGNPLRGDSLEGRLLPKAETADRRLDGGEPAVQRGQSAAHLVLLGHLLRFCAGKRHGAELHRFLCALLHLSRLAGLYSAVHDADGLFGLHGGQSADPQAFSEGRRSMRADASFAVPVKLWALLCVFAGVTIGGNVLLTCILTGGALLYLVLQRNFRLAASYGCFYLLLALLLYGIRFHGLRMPVFSEFYVLMFWNLSPIFLVSWDLITTPPGMLSAFLSRLRMPTPFILGLLVVFRFFPTMRTELKGVGRSMKNRGLTAAGQLLAHPMQSMEYVLVPFLLRVLQLADQLSVSAVARGAERPGVRGSYYEKRGGARDHIAAAACALVTASYLVLERSMA